MSWWLPGVMRYWQETGLWWAVQDNLFKGCYCELKIHLPVNSFLTGRLKLTRAALWQESPTDAHSRSGSPEATSPNINPAAIWARHILGTASCWAESLPSVQDASNTHTPGPVPHHSKSNYLWIQGEESSTVPNWEPRRSGLLSHLPAIQQANLLAQKTNHWHFVSMAIRCASWHYSSFITTP